MACATLRCDAFYVTTLQHWYRTYQCGNVGRNCIMEEKDGIALPRPEALTPCSPVQKGQPCVTGENTVTHILQQRIIIYLQNSWILQTNVDVIVQS